MGPSTLENSIKMKSKELASITGPMAKYIKVNLKISGNSIRIMALE